MGARSATPVERQTTNRTNKMKTLRNIIVTAIAAAFVTVTSNAAPANWPPGPYKKIEKKQQAMDCCEAGGKVALACPDCKTLNEKGEKKDAAAFFDPKAKHDCAGCKGVVTAKPSPSGRRIDVEVTHECSKCK